MTSEKKPNLLRRILFLGFAVWGAVLFGSVPLNAQVRRPIPAEEYYSGLRAMESGRFRQAETIYRAAIHDAVQVGSMPWLDSICYHAQYGEVLYQLGDIDSALNEWEQSIDIYLQNKDWLGRVDYLMSPTSSAKNPVPWGDGERPVPVGVFPKEATIITGDVITKERLQQGGMMARQEMHRIDPIAIIKSVALAVRRRNEVLGPLSASDPRTNEMVTCFSTRSVGPNHWSVTWLDCLFGLSLQASGKGEEGEKVLTKSLLMAGQYDHSLTACALLALGDWYQETGKANEAAACFFEASVSAYQYGEITEAAEGLEKYADAVRLEGGMNPDRIEAGLAWATSSKNPLLALTFLLISAENCLDAGRPGDAAARLHTVEAALRPAGLADSRWGDRWHRLAALTDYASGNTASGDKNLLTAVNGAAAHSLRLYQLGQLERMLHGDNEWDLTPRVASELYEILLHTADAVDWVISPLDTLAFETRVGPEPYENWFQILMTRNMPDQAFEVAERTRQVRYQSRLAFGGRPTAVRTLLETPAGRLAESLRPLRSAILDSHPVYAEAAKEDEEIQFQLAKLPVLPDKENAAHFDLIQRHWNTAQVREQVIAQMTAERIFVPPLFPPLYTVKEYQASIPDDGTLMTFFAAGGEIYGFLITPEVFEGWHVASIRNTAAAINGFLKAAGINDGNKSKMQKDLTSDAWKKTGRTLLKNLLGDDTTGAKRFSVQFRRLAIVPDGPLWYLPFEALCLPQGKNGDLIPLVLAPDLTISYAPAAALAFDPYRNRTEKPFSEIGLVPGICFPREKEETNDEALKRIEEDLPQSVRILPAGIDLPSTAVASRIPTLAVLNELAGFDGNWALFQTGKGSETIGVYEFLPWGAPETVLLPVFRSAGEGGAGGDADGSELFMPLMTLMARGTRTILISRWRTGGRSAYDLTAGLLHRLAAGQDPSAAWRGELESFFETPLHLDEEPRYRGSTKEEITGSSPFFWGAYLIADRSMEILPPPENTLSADRIRNPENGQNEVGQNADEQNEGGEGESAPNQEKFPKEAENGNNDADKAENDGGPGEDALDDADSAPRAGDNAADTDENIDENADEETLPESENLKPNQKAAPSADKQSAKQKPADKNSTEKNSADKKSNEKKPEVKLEEKEENPPRAPSPLSDEELKRADEEADDFYAPNRRL